MTRVTVNDSPDIITPIKGTGSAGISNDPEVPQRPGTKICNNPDSTDTYKIKTKNAKAFYQFLNTHIDFILHKTLGVLSIITGGLEFYTPEFLSVTVSQPLVMVGVGLGLVSGKTLFEIIQEMLEKG